MQIRNNMLFLTDILKYLLNSFINQLQFKVSTTEENEIIRKRDKLFEFL